MSIADRFEHAPEAGLVRFYDPRAARRQFRVSLALIVILAMAAFTFGFLSRFDEPAQQIVPVPNAHEPHLAVAIAMDEIPLPYPTG